MKRTAAIVLFVILCLGLLARCDWAIESSHSSYSQMVALMRGAEYVGPDSKPGGIRGGRYEDVCNLG